jgi:hypothetical protein
MLDNLKLYKFLTYILIPISLIFGLIDLIMLLVSLANPTGLLGVFIMACFVIYTFTSFKFLIHGIQLNKHQKKSLKDFIKVNAIVSLFFCVIICSQSILILTSNLKEVINTMNEMAASQPGYSKEAFDSMAVSLIKGICLFFIVTGVIGLIHILMTFRLLKKYEVLFETK